MAVFDANIESFGLAGAVDFRGITVKADAECNGGLFVDGAHDRVSVLADIDRWERHVGPRGQVLFHDAFSAVGTVVALPLRYLANRWFRLLSSGRTLAAAAREDLGVGATVASGLSMSARCPCFAGNLAAKLLLCRGPTDVAQVLHYRERVYRY